MKFGIVCDVDSKMHMGSGTTIEHGRKSYIFYCNEDGFLSQLRIISEVDDPEKYYYNKTNNPDRQSFQVNYSFEEHIKDDLIRELQHLESILALSGNLKRVNWNKSTLEYYPETEAEHERIKILPAWFYIWELKIDDPTEMDRNVLDRLVKGKDVFAPLVAPMAFYREGRTEFRLGRYIDAFFKFYFVIEGLFGNGQWRTDDVIRELSKSKVFTGFVQKIVDEVSRSGLINST
jgi:hypothetical protein